MMKKTAHIISHSHWDREWYMPFEGHRYYLIQLMDDLLELFATDPNFRSFHMDGQTIMLEDYLNIRPEKEAEVRKYIQDGRLVIGPWYILQDAFLTSAEANVRNLLYGIKDTETFGQKREQIGYFPDTFGIYGQAPQLLAQAGIRAAVFGRGVTPTGFNNQVQHDDYSSPFSELIWEAPDGSQVLGILLANWYSNGNEIPTDEDEAQTFWVKKLRDAERFASTSQLLFMNGCDHQPVQKDVTQAIKVAETLFPDVAFKHSKFHDYLTQIKEELPKELQKITGELRNQKTDGWSTLVNTASARIYLKQANDRCQTLLTNVLEPMGLLVENKSLHRDFSEYYWKLLMENHPHDSICGCSIDAVHREMKTRFEKVEAGATTFIAEQGKEIAAQINTLHDSEEAIPLVVLKTNGTSGKRVVRHKVAMKKIYFDEMDFRHIPDRLKEIVMPTYRLEFPNKGSVPIEVQDAGVRFGYDLPRDGFRRPYYARELEVTFSYDSDLYLGYECGFLVPVEEKQTEARKELIGDPSMNTLENEAMKVMIHRNGSYSILDKTTGFEYRHLGIYEDVGDIGNEYMFKASSDGVRYTTEACEASIRIIENNSLCATVEICQTLSVPAAADERLKEEQERLVWHPDRKAGRSKERTDITLRTELTLEQGAKGLKVNVNIDNTAKDHRMRALFPVERARGNHYADSIYEIVERPNTPDPKWQNPAFDHHMQRLVSLDNGEYGLTIATKGLHEYEIVSDSIAVTLLRSVGELGDWGLFETPEAQCFGQNEAQFVLLPHKGDVLSANVYVAAYDDPVEPTVIQTEQSMGPLPHATNLFQWSGEGLVLTACKPTMDGRGMILRWFNPKREGETLIVQSTHFLQIYRCTILEEQIEKLGTGNVQIEVRPQEIVTLRFE
ncbi:alpha-mannosidase [Halalkalibacterium halodurans]|uniref:alpha-mannosidase n=2 Tax=Halalkalibacterium halodurans TaxID=86665 RepID=UPI002AA97D31|nr:alpha-mannosidase [Halalkalibacterium halodurans]MDY7221290.1 alpha-mannosidase [Halalkalibacterium halodurans]MDY7240529.1 alpha-mannosidase [Halalkalibacterium halodurans]